MAAPSISTAVPRRWAPFQGSGGTIALGSGIASPPTAPGSTTLSSTITGTGGVAHRAAARSRRWQPTATPAARRSSAGTLRLGTGGTLATSGAHGRRRHVRSQRPRPDRRGGSGGTIALGNGRLTAGDSGNTTVASAITGHRRPAGRAAAAGTVTLELGTNTYTGGTTVSGGTAAGATTTSYLRGDASSTTPSGGVQLQSHHRHLRRQSCRAAAAAAGQERHRHGDLTGANTYGGGTTVAGGILGGTTSSLQGNILNNAMAGFEQSSNGTYAGVSQRAGARLRLRAPARSILTRANSPHGSARRWRAAPCRHNGPALGSATSDSPTATVTFDQSTTGAYARRSRRAPAPAQPGQRAPAR
mgnify:CR=1 FL=1